MSYTKIKTQQNMYASNVRSGTNGTVIKHKNNFDKIVIEADSLDSRKTYETLNDKIQQIYDLANTAFVDNSFYITAISGHDINGHRIVRIDNGVAYYANNSDVEFPHSAVGMTVMSTLKDYETQIQVSGDITEPSWNFDSGKPVFLHLNGEISTNCPDTGYVQIVGTTITNNTISINIQQPIVQ